MRCRLLMFLLLLIFPLYSVADQVALALQNANLNDVILLLAKALNLNVIISPTVSGVVSLQVQENNAADAFNALLITHDLAARKLGKVLLIAPRAVIAQQLNDEIQTQLLEENAAPLDTQLWQVRYARASDIAQLIAAPPSLLTKRGYLRYDNRTNTLFAEDVPLRLAKVAQLIKKLDVPTRQINIQARLVSIDRSAEKELGILFAIQSLLDIAPAPTSYSLAIGKLADGTVLDIKLSALENEGKAELISRPSLFTANQQTAYIAAGEEVPYQEVSESGGTAVSFKRAVLGLTVTPQILPKGEILLQLKINQDRPSDELVLGVPKISTREIVTSVLVKNKQTVVLGGIYENNEEEGQIRVPWLSALPVLGKLFTQRSHLREKRELLIFVTPTIMN